MLKFQGHFKPTPQQLEDQEAIRAQYQPWQDWTGGSEDSEEFNQFLEVEAPDLARKYRVNDFFMLESLANPRPVQQPQPTR